MTKVLTGAAVAAAMTFGTLSLPAFAADGPTMQQCETGWKDGMKWTKADFDKACTKMMKK